MTKLEQMLIIAKSISYIEPHSSNIEDWTDDELTYKSINISLNNEIQLRAGINMCSRFPPLKIVYKAILSGYITYFTQLHHIQNNYK